jgi:hypothetical protein
LNCRNRIDSRSRVDALFLRLISCRSSFNEQGAQDRRRLCNEHKQFRNITLQLAIRRNKNILIRPLRLVPATRLHHSGRRFLNGLSTFTRPKLISRCCYSRCPASSSGRSARSQSSQRGYRVVEVGIVDICGHFPNVGLIAGPFLQGGSDARETLERTDILQVPKKHLRHAGLDRSGRYYRATLDDGAPIINVPAQMSPTMLVSTGLTSLKDDRVMARCNRGARFQFRLNSVRRPYQS